VVPCIPLSAQDSTPKWYDRIQFEGDARLRHETFSLEDVTPRGRVRIRMRAGFTLPISKTISTGVRIATAEPGSVTSHNVTLTGGLVPKNIVLDRAYLTWTPSTRFTMTGGKFQNALARPAALFRPELIYDDEVAPEGLHEQVTLVQSKTGVLRRFAVMGEQWIMQELADQPDTWMLGGQAVADFTFSSRTTAILTGGYYGYLRGNRLALARNTNSQLLVTNSVVLRDGTVLEGGKPLLPVTSNLFATFVNAFELVSGSAGISVDRVFGRMPLQMYVDVVHNAGASDENTGYWAALSAGTIRRKGDWAATVMYTHVPTEATLSMYSYSDLGLGGTNNKGVILQVQYRPSRDFTLSARHHIISPVNAATAATDKTLQRLILDAGVSF
jgi:hypothetical protein